MYKTAYSETQGHPDKICDQIADTLVDEYLRRDANSRVNISVSGSHGAVMISGDVDSRADFDVAAFAKKAYQEIGHPDELEVFANIEKPKADFLKATQKGKAGSTTTVYGYATKETREYLPYSVVLAHSITRKMDNLRKTDSAFNWLRPDGKTQVTSNKKDISHISISAQHIAGIDVSTVKSQILDEIISPVVGELEGVKVFVNAGGSFHEGGLKSSPGQSNRKVASDTYGGLLPHVAGSLSGKSPDYPGRAGAYMARFAAKSLVANGYCNNIFVTVNYVLGQAEPVLIQARCGSGRDISSLVSKEFDFRIPQIIERLGLAKPIYRDTSYYGHFGKDHLPWEKTVSV